MLPFGIGFSEIVLIFLVLIIFVGPDGLPQAIRSIVKVMRTLRRFVDEIRYSEEFDDMKRELLDPLQEARRFNPQARARDWVRKELEQPIQELRDEITTDHSDDRPDPHHSSEVPLDLSFQCEGNDPEELTFDQQGDEASKGDDHASAIDPSEVDETASSTDQQHIDNLHVDQSLSSDQNDDADDEGLPIATIDPLDRGLSFPQHKIDTETETVSDPISTQPDKVKEEVGLTDKQPPTSSLSSIPEESQRSQQG